MQKFSRIIDFAFIAVIAALFFEYGYQSVQSFFLVHLIPLPSEFPAIAVGLGLACWSTAVLLWFRNLRSKKLQKSNAYPVDSLKGGSMLNKEKFVPVVAGLILLSGFLSSQAFAEDNNAKLDQILAKQDLILDNLAQIREELNIVKVRASQR